MHVSGTSQDEDEAGAGRVDLNLKVRIVVLKSRLTCITCANFMRTCANPSIVEVHPVLVVRPRGDDAASAC